MVKIFSTRTINNVNFLKIKKKGDGFPSPLINTIKTILLLVASKTECATCVVLTEELAEFIVMNFVAAGAFHHLALTK
jgi:hypothetical protein